MQSDTHCRRGLFFDRNNTNTIMAFRGTKAIAAIYASSLVFWIATVLYREHTRRELSGLKRVRFTLFTLDCNGWCILHLLSYALMGWLAPEYWPAVVLIGTLFEFVEMFLSKASRFIEHNVAADTIINTVGVLSGVLLRTAL